MRLRRRARYLNGVKAFMDGYATRGVFHRTLEDEAIDGRLITIEGRRLVNFGSCSYLGLETDPRLRLGAIEAIERYGTQLSSSRAYLSLPLYAELESLLDRLFDGYTVVTASTTLGHQAALPVLIGEDDAVIVDHRVHATVRTAAELTRSYGATVDVVPHNDVNALESLVRERRTSHRAVWYLADGVYSMHGDFAPMADLAVLLDRYDCFHLYLDDAHGMSWTGRHGCGYVLSQLPHHPRMVVCASLNKSFGAGGGVLVFPDASTRDRVFTVGGPMVFTGPLQPGSLGAAVASARIHLSGEIESMQAELVELVRYFHRAALELELPVYVLDESPTKLLGMGLAPAAAAMTQRLHERGLWTNVAGPPAVSPRGSGVRAGITRHLTRRDLDDLANAFHEELPGVLSAEDSSVDDLRVYLKLPSTWRAGQIATGGPSVLTVEYRRSIDEMDSSEWDRCFEGRGAFTAAALRLFEGTFRHRRKPADCWSFHYFAVRGADGAPVALTFFTSTLWKDDIFASASVSEHVEAQREDDPQYLTSTVLMMGCLLSEGEHLYLDRDRDWRGALRLVLAAVNRIACRIEARSLVLRDLPSDDPELDDVLQRAGLMKLALPDSMQAVTSWDSFDAYLASLSSKHRYDLRRSVLPNEGRYDVEVLAAGGREPSGREWSQIYRAYRSVHERALELNTFPLPEELFHRMLRVPGWALALFKGHQSISGDPRGTIHGFGVHFCTDTTLSLLVVGLDYRLVTSHALYKCILLHALRRARALGKGVALLGMGTATPKRRFGAEARSRAAFAGSENSFALDTIADLEARHAYEGGAARRRPAGAS